MAVEFDLFLSCAGTDREAARKVRDALRGAGLRVFLDEEDIAPFEGITPRIESALQSSAALLAYYSPLFSGRPACQRELTAAFLAGQREGDPIRRILVVNPVDPRSDHLLPAELADARYSLPSAEPRALVRAVRARLADLTGPIGPVTHEPPRWLGRIPGSVGFVGRYRELWELHTALHRVDTGMTSEPTSGPVASVVGMTGIGKSELVAAYGFLFGAAYTEGTVLWIDLAGTVPSAGAVLDRFHTELRTLADQVGVPVDGLSDVRVAAALAERLPGRTLFVLDDLPAGLDPAVLDRLVIPAGDRVRTVLITSARAYDEKTTVVPVGPMDEGDAAELLRAYRGPEAGERPAFDRMVSRLGGHPMVIRGTGRLLRDRQGLVSFDRYAGHAAETDPLAEVARLLRPDLDGLGGEARTALRLAVLVAPVALPTSLVRRVFELVRSDAAGAEAAGAGLAELRHRELAEHAGDTWRVHSLVREAAREHVKAPAPDAPLGLAAAEVIAGLLAPAGEIADGALLIRHAEALLEEGRLPIEQADRLRRPLAGYHEALGQPARAVPYRREVVAHHPDSAADLAAAASACGSAGEAVDAVELARRALALAADPDVAGAAHQALAEALDALGRYGEADPLWERMTSDPGVTLPVRVAHARALRLRGRRADVDRVTTAVLAEIAAVDPTGADRRLRDAAQAVQLELARVEMQTDAQRAARTRAEAVFEHYRTRGEVTHVRALEAQEVLAESMLTLDLWELRPDPRKWQESVRRLAELRDRHRSTYGPASVIPLAAAVSHAYALVSLGRRDEGRAELDRLLPELAGRLGEEHPLWLRALFSRGLVDAQRGDHAAARALFERALAGQRAALGTGHPHTLRTQYELAVALKLTGGTGWQSLLTEIRRSAPRRSDLYAQSLLAAGLLLLPARVIRMVTRRRPEG